MEGKKCDQPCFDLVFSAAAKGTNPKFQWNITTMKEVRNIKNIEKISFYSFDEQQSSLIVHMNI